MWENQKLLITATGPVAGFCNGPKLQAFPRRFTQGQIQFVVSVALCSVLNVVRWSDPRNELISNVLQLCVA
jgi:hypothetical protein